MRADFFFLRPRTGARPTAHLLHHPSSTQAARDRALELTGPESKRRSAQLDLEAEAAVSFRPAMFLSPLLHKRKDTPTPTCALS